MKVVPLYNKVAGTFLVAGVSLMVAAGAAHAQGLTIPASSTVDVNDGTLVVPGNITISATSTLAVDDGTINLTGDWTDSGTFTAGTNSTVILSGTTTQTLQTGGAGAGNLFYNLTQSGSGTTTLNPNALDIDGTFTISGGTFDANGIAMTVAGDWANTGTFTANANTVTLDGSDQTISGTTTFATLTKSASTDTLSFADNSTTTVSTSLTLTGVADSAGQRLILDSVNSNGTDTFVLNLSDGGVQDLEFLSVDNSEANNLDLIARNSVEGADDNTDDGEASPHWVFGAGTFTWEGDISTDWEVAGNWDIGLVPGSEDTVIIPDVTGGGGDQPIMTADVTVENLTIQSGANMQTDGFSLTVDTTFDNEGILILDGDETTVSLTQDTDSGTFLYAGDGDGTSDQHTIFDFGATDYYQLSIIPTVSPIDTFITADDLTIANNITVSTSTLNIDDDTLTVNGTLSVTAGTLSAGNGNIDANGAVSISPTGTLTAPGSGLSFTVAGNWTKGGAATFDANGGEVTFDTTGTSTFTGSTTFNDLTSTVSNKTLRFQANSTQTIGGTLTLTGTGGNLITLERSGGSAGDRFNLSVSAAQSVLFLDVNDSEVTGSADITCISCEGQAAAKNNDNGEGSPQWVFEVLTIDVPEEGSITDTTPTIIGQATANSTVEVRESTCAGTLHATTTADSNGNWRVEVADGDPSDSDALSIGAHALVPCSGADTGGTVNITTVASPTPAQQPQVTSHSDNDRINGSTPTIEGVGGANQSVTIVALDENDDIILTAGSGTTDGSGSYSITLTTELPKGTNALSVTVNGVASDIIDVSLTDPFGIVFNSATNAPIDNATVTIFRASDSQAAVVGTDLASDDVNPLITPTSGLYSFVAANADYFITVSAPGFTFPSKQFSLKSNRVITTGSRGETFTVNNIVQQIDIPMDPKPTLFRIEKDANKGETHVGDVVTYTITIENLSNTTVQEVLLEDRIPAGFKYIDNRVILDDIPISDPSGGRPLVFDVGSFGTGQTKTLKYQLVVGSSVIPGDYTNTAVIKFANGVEASNRATETVEVIVDPLFEMGTVIGKVFFDLNENGIQDPPEFSPMDQKVVSEDPVPNARIVMEDGTVITADKNGQFSVPGLTPGRHLLRIDERTLPEGSYLTTDKVVVIDVTPGLPVKVNFGVNMDYTAYGDPDQMYFTNNVRIDQELEKAEPRLHAALFDGKIVTFNDVFARMAEFRIFTNYSPFIEYWRLDIFDKDTKKLIKKFEGNRFNIHDPILWDGRDEKGEHILTNRDYEYIVTVEGADGNYDETEPRDITFINFEEREGLEEYFSSYPKNPETYKKWVEENYRKNSLRVQTILVDGETVKFDRIDANLKSIRVMKDGTLFAEVPVVEKRGLTAQEIIEGGFDRDTDKPPLEVILPRGDYDVLVQEENGELADLVPEKKRTPEAISAIQEDVGRPVKTYTKDISVGEDHFFLVAMGDARIGYTRTRGNVEPVQHDDQFEEGFWTEGKAAFYLKGKILGKFLVTSSFDSERERKELFRGLDEDEYYPVYGDESTIDYRATDTQGNLYVLVEWDKSSALWGNYAIGFDDTEFSQYTRTLYGGKIDFESLSSTKYGDPRTKAVVFRARAQQKSAHVELLATGGSLYYMRHKDVIEGSEKVMVEVRDKITGLVISSKEMVEGADYEMDYDSGRILFWQPVPILMDSFSIIDSQLLEGNPVYVVVDYEYDLKDKVDEDSYGGRIQQALTDNVIVGGTYVMDTQDDQDYELRGADVTLRLGEDASVTAEYAQTVSEAEGTFVSTDGGLTYTELATGDSTQGEAYGIKGDARLFERVGLSAYYKWVDSDFSTSATTAQQGKEVIGFGTTFDITDNTRLTARYDIQNIIDDGNTQTQLQVGAEQTKTTLVQLIHEARRLRLTGEYKRTEVKERNQFASETNTEEDTIAVRADYDIRDDITISAEQQFTLSGEEVAHDHKTTIGATVKPTENITVRAEETFAENGTATTVGIAANLNERLAMSGEYSLLNEAGNLGSSALLGAEAQVDDQTKLKTSFGLKEEPGGEEVATLAFGGTSQVDEKTTTESQIAISDSSLDGETTSFTFGSRTKISEDIELASTRTFGTTKDGESLDQTFGLARVKDGRKLEGTLSRKYSENETEVSESNIFGLTGDINDNWALTGSLERADVQNLDGTVSERSAFALAAGFVKENKETGQKLKSSTKLEFRQDEGEKDTEQFLVYNTTEGKLNENVTVFGKVEFSKTRNTSEGFTEASHREIMFGGAYRPVRYDRLNLLGRYTYLEDDAPSGQEDISDVLEERAHIISTDVIFDINERWSVTERFAYRIGEEKVEGFDFTKTHTWLMIHRLSYKIDRDWSVGGEFRMLTQKEAEDVKRGFLIEAARNIGEYAQLGVGYNFTDFNDDLTELDFTAHGPFIRMTGKLYDRTPEEIERAKQRWLNEKIREWAWTMVRDELSRSDSPILYELNEYFLMARAASAEGDLGRARSLYKDVVVAGQMMHEEAEEFIRSQIAEENRLKELNTQADKYIRKGQYEKAKKILEKILDEVETGMLE